ncbi:MAG TPA: dienelactone hydrolase family protein [Burkholderiales bacterium]|nr:dienelactone hydrolase family protein [Burkholderiales bacterium]
MTFPSRDGKTRLVGYLYRPQGIGPFPAVVMLHGRSGVYSSAAHGRYDAAHLMLRHKAWGNFWVRHGYLALLVDSFGPRGYAAGFPIHSYRSRPPAVSEQTVRPLDAYGALDYLRSRADVIGSAIGVQGWSNGGMTVLATMALHPPGIENPTPRTGFRAALAFYPSCRKQAHQAYRPYAPLLVLVATNDQEVSPTVCEKFAADVSVRGGDIAIVRYAGATHAFDEPSRKRQRIDANRVALQDSEKRAAAFFHRYLKDEDEGGRMKDDERQVPRIKSER